MSSPRKHIKIKPVNNDSKPISSPSQRAAEREVKQTIARRKRALDAQARTSLTTANGETIDLMTLPSFKKKKSVSDEKVNEKPKLRLKKSFQMKQQGN